MATLSKFKRQYRRIQRPKVKICTWCGTEYETLRSDSLYCSASCTTLASLQRFRKAKPEEYEARLKKNAQKAKEKRYEQIEIERRMKLAEEEKLKQQIEVQKQEELSQEARRNWKLELRKEQVSKYRSAAYEQSCKETILRKLASQTLAIQSKIETERAKLVNYLDENGDLFENYRSTYGLKMKQIKKMEKELVELESKKQPEALHLLYVIERDKNIANIPNDIRL